MHRRFPAGASVMLVAGLVVSACAARPASKAEITWSSTTAMTLEDTPTRITSTTVDLQRFTDTADHFTVSIPASWQQLDLTSPEAIAAYKKVVAYNPKLADAIGSPDDLVSQGSKVAAVDGLGGVVNVMVHSTPGVPNPPSSSDWEDAAQALAPELEQAGGTVLSHQVATINGRSALQIQVDLPIQTGAATVTVHETVDVFTAKDTMYWLTLAGPSPVIDEIAASFEITDGRG